MVLMNESGSPLIDIPKINWRGLKFKKTKHIIELIDTYGPDILYTVDESGFFPIHWAVIYGNAEVVDKMIKTGVSPRLKAKIYDEPEPIHLAALEGNGKVIDLLVSYGINIDVKDRSGCTPLMRAAMFGRSYRSKSSETVLNLISYGADVNQTDISGHNCLHYAVQHNNEETVHLLLNLGLDPNQRTNNGFLPIDLAMKWGNGYLMKLLGPLTHGITQTDLQLLLMKYKKKGKREKCIQMLMQFAGTIVLLSVVSVLFYGFPQYILYYLPNTSSEIPIHIILIILNVLVLISLYKTCGSDPGYLPLNTHKYKQVLESRVKSGLRAQSSNGAQPDLYKHIRLCHTCSTVQTHRSTHCRFCKRCIASFDHHCIYLSTCLGQNNRFSFFSLGLSLFLCGFLSSYIVAEVALAEDSLFTPYHWFNLCYTSQFAIIGGVLTVCNLRRAAINLTTSEEFKSSRYSYLTDSEGRFVNPFDKGSYLRNTIDYFTTKHYNYSKFNAYEC